MKNKNFPSLRLRTQAGAMFVTIEHQPFPLLDASLMKQLDDLALTLLDDSSIQVVVFDSADPDFFIAHGDMGFVKDPEAFMQLQLGDKSNAHLNPMMALLERYRTLPQVTIGKLKGLARCGGAEFLTALDMRFAAEETAGLGQTEALMGIIPGAGGTAYLPPLVGRARSLEIVLGADLFDARTAERYGWINRALPAAELDGFVESLALRIGSLVPGVVLAAKAAIDAGATLPIGDALKIENEQLGAVFSQPIAVERTLEALRRGAQTREEEKTFELLLQSF
ncbi:enoyl-CoA hydratase/isomerase family protein [Xanthomonas arboricola pv. corylina]|jgi:enoyl-CoA hydratase/carnithine racemase|uniref:enoyl-CoA hydratase/isomerase family protein n=1 Tax=Xanthomonas arboricola TaxID=56448 RepID=UPI00058505FE|nr:enoyl-CoA hydratase/isomerase family protein [Xanthomonas arboricola]